MPNTFKRQTGRGVGTTPVRLGNYTVATGATSTIIGLSVANTSNAPISIDVYHSDGTNSTYLVKGAPVPVGGALVVVGGDQKVVLQAGDGVFVVSSAASSADLIMSILEVTP